MATVTQKNESTVDADHSTVRYSLPNPLTEDTQKYHCNTEFPNTPPSWEGTLQLCTRTTPQLCTRTTPLSLWGGRRTQETPSPCKRTTLAGTTTLNCPTLPSGHGLSPSGQGGSVKSLYADTPSFSPGLWHLSPPRTGKFCKL